MLARVVFRARLRVLLINPYSLWRSAPGHVLVSPPVFPPALALFLWRYSSVCLSTGEVRSKKSELWRYSSVCLSTGEVRCKKSELEPRTRSSPAPAPAASRSPVASPRRFRGRPRVQCRLNGVSVRHGGPPRIGRTPINDNYIYLRDVERYMQLSTYMSPHTILLIEWSQCDDFAALFGFPPKSDDFAALFADDFTRRTPHTTHHTPHTTHHHTIRLG